MMKILFSLTLVALASFCNPVANADTFGSGANAFDIDFVTIGSPGNSADTLGDPNPSGKVDYTYRLGELEISESMIDKANALGGLGITHDNRGPNKPASSISWYEAAHFVNWLNTENGYSPAYKFNSVLAINDTFALWTPADAGYNPNNLYRNSLAKYVLPSSDEWYKAAYYDSVTGDWYEYPTGSSTAPDGLDFVGDTAFDAVFDDGGSISGPHDINNVGVLSPYGTAGQGGNIWEWEETDFDLVNDAIVSPRGVRGGDWNDSISTLLASSRGIVTSSSEHANVGFRVASVPEPSTLLLAGLVASFGLLTRRYKK